MQRLAFVATVCGALAAAAAAQDDLFDVVYPLDWVGNIDHSGFTEPSGLVYHPERGTLFVVGDEGHIAEMQTDGSVVQLERYAATDFEGVTCDPATGLLYLAVEGREAIFEVAPDGLALVREFTVERQFNGRTVLAEGGGGFEGITLITGADAGAVVLMLTNQSFDLDSANDVSALVEVELPASGGSATPLPIRRHLPLAIRDLSALHYDAASRQLWVVSDGPNTLTEVSLTGEVLSCRAFPGADQEGLAVGGDGLVYIAQGLGGIHRYRPRPPAAD